MYMYMYIFTIAKKCDCHFRIDCYCSFRSSVTHCTLLTETRDTKRLRYQSIFTEDIPPHMVVKVELLCVLSQVKVKVNQ